MHPGKLQFVEQNESVTTKPELTKYEVAIVLVVELKKQYGPESSITDGRIDFGCAKEDSDDIVTNPGEVSRVASLELIIVPPATFRRCIIRAPHPPSIYN